MRLTPDSNILVRAAISTTGPAQRLIAIVGASVNHRLILSDYILGEVRRVLRRPRLQAISPQSDAEIDRYLDLLEQAADMVDPVVEKPVVIKDPADDLVLYTAVKGNAEVLCTLNSSHFGMPNVQSFCLGRGIRVLTDVELLRELLG